MRRQDFQKNMCIFFLKTDNEKNEKKTFLKTRMVAQLASAQFLQLLLVKRFALNTFSNKLRQKKKNKIK